MKVKNVYLIHHSHTDIGYTERQDKIMRYHSDFICQAIDILDEIHMKGKKEWEGFVWQCENYWQVENFYEVADEEYRSKFEHYISTGEIGLSGNYLNMTELIGSQVLDVSLDKVCEYAKKINHPIKAGMSADINGMAWGYAESLYNHGIKYFYSALHPHHGMFPLYRKVMPFYWETPGKNKILVWNGEHYHIGNELFMAPHGGTAYMLEDKYSPFIKANLLLNKNSADTEEKEHEISRYRIENYLNNLEKENYPYDFVPLPVSGVITDNAPPSGEIAHRVQKLNDYYEGQITFKMVNLEEFFHIVEERCSNIPTYSGDWTDWWADGIGSTPSEVKVYREAARKLNICRKLDPQNTLGNRELVEKSVKEQMLYAEHTWGYSSSVSEPWESFVNLLELKKGAYAVSANTHISKNLDLILAKKGEVSIRHDRPQIYKVCNPHSEDLKTKAYLYIEFWEYIDGIRYDCSLPIEVIDVKTKEKIPCQVKKIARATQVEIDIFVKAKEERKLKIQLKKAVPCTIQNHAYRGAEGIEDIMDLKKLRQDEDMIETDFFQIRMDDDGGIVSIIYKKDHSELMRADVLEGAFTGIYEKTDLEQSACETRRCMGRNRKAKSTRRYYSKLKNRRIVEKGDIYTAIVLDYELKGTGMYTIFLKIYQHSPKLEVMVRVHKESHWEPENLYVSLPFTAGSDSETYIDKTGCMIRPGIDQLPGSCQDFYLIQNAVIWKGENKNVAVILRDTPLITLGNLKPGPITLCNGNDKERNRSQVYSWPMNNFWETNFKVDLGGFYEFSYTLFVKEDCSIARMFQVCEEENEGLLSFYSE